MLEIKNLVKSFPYSYGRVLNKINLTLNNGDFCVVIGSNGSGKSTLFKTISGEYKLDKGGVVLDNTPVHKNSLYQRSTDVSSVTQNISTGVIEEMTLLENMALSFMRGKKAKLKKYDLYESAAVKALKKANMGLEKYLNQPLLALSGGQKQRVAIARALAMSPKLMLFDEPTSALDVENVKEVREVISDLSKEITSVLVTHDVRLARDIASRIIFMENGEILADESVGKFFTGQKSSRIKAFLDKVL